MGTTLLMTAHLSKKTQLGPKVKWLNFAVADWKISNFSDENLNYLYLQGRMTYLTQFKKCF